MLLLNHVWILLALPLGGAAVLGLFARRWPKAWIDVVGVGSVGLAFLAALETIREFTRYAGLHPGVPYSKSFFTWIVAGPFRADFALQVDQLTVVMLLVVTLVGLLIHIYSTGYMAHEGGYARFFAQLNLFMFFMLLLVLAGNYVLLFVGWEGVGLCSYLLIGFYFLKTSAANAGKKAFIVTRIGDFGFTVGILLLFWTFGSVDYSSVFAAAQGMPVETPGHAGALTAICLLLLCGAVGKSAQLPLYVWLPDAMEGPTPVSALIHAATMVTAGVYMVARSHVLYTHAPLAMAAVAGVGAITAVYAATIGLVQTDIKKVLAYSTISQLGYMFLGCGVGAYAAGVFHLMTHAFFKGLLFLAAGSVIHALGGEQDMRRMGGLWRKIPWTYATMLVATLAIAGAPGFSGFFSKDEILLEAYASPYGSRWLYRLGLIGTLLTAFYMFRLLLLTFHGASRVSPAAQQHVHESPRNMVAPLAALAFFSAVAGWLAAPTFWGGENYFARYLEPVFASSAVLKAQAGPALATESSALVWQLSGLATGAALAGFLVAWWFYWRRPQTSERLAESFHAPYQLLLRKYYVDEIYAWTLVRPLLWVSDRWLWHGVDEGLIDGAVNRVADSALTAGGRVRRLQSGNERSYAAWIVVGAVLFILVLLWRVS